MITVGQLRKLLTNFADEAEVTVACEVPDWGLENSTIDFLDPVVLDAESDCVIAVNRSVVLDGCGFYTKPDNAQYKYLDFQLWPRVEPLP